MHEPQLVGCDIPMDSEGSIATLATHGMDGTAILRHLFVACTFYFLVEGVDGNKGSIPLLCMGGNYSALVGDNHFFGLAILTGGSLFFGRSLRVGYQDNLG